MSTRILQQLLPSAQRRYKAVIRIPSHFQAAQTHLPHSTISKLQTPQKPTTPTMRPRANAFSTPNDGSPWRFADLILRFTFLLEPVSVTTLEPEQHDCPNCEHRLCDFYSFRHSHVCDNELACEPAYRMIACGHVGGQECLLRYLERYRRCPTCEAVEYDERGNETA
ncbi:hypothetical protein CC86DRAFT_64364 [Ophiobolus disseminans]|uniref:RING-type domain-containing protein n=1 Tax=Ophiobolus disseminans TaxID=1469910 RepID=A0A6A6ZRF6_9PLEO|nr:hypothetical protein CC86DRAFT_64364 [Ophiobolus disseminans]